MTIEKIRALYLPSVTEKREGFSTILTDRIAIGREAALESRQKIECLPTPETRASLQ